MDKKLDLAKVDAALKRAAQTAVSGTRDERAGRFMYREADSGRYLAQHNNDGTSNTKSGRSEKAKRS